MITVGNRSAGAQGEYIGRPTVLSNRFRIGRDGNRAQVIAKYREWLARNRHQPGVSAELRRLAVLAANGDLTLVCWCAPLPCHGDVVAEVLRSMVPA